MRFTCITQHTGSLRLIWRMKQSWLTVLLKDTRARPGIRMARNRLILHVNQKPFHDYCCYVGQVIDFCTASMAEILDGRGLRSIDWIGLFGDSEWCDLKLTTFEGRNCKSPSVAVLSNLSRTLLIFFCDSSTSPCNWWFVLSLCDVRAICSASLPSSSALSFWSTTLKPNWVICCCRTEDMGESETL